MAGHGSRDRLGLWHGHSPHLKGMRYRRVKNVTGHSHPKTNSTVPRLIMSGDCWRAPAAMHTTWLVEDSTREQTGDSQTTTVTLNPKPSRQRVNERVWFLHIMSMLGPSSRWSIRVAWLLHATKFLHCNSTTRSHHGMTYANEHCLLALRQCYGMLGSAQQKPERSFPATTSNVDVTPTMLPREP